MKNISFSFHLIKKIDLDKENISTYVKDIIDSEFKKCGKISIIFCDDEYILQINNQFLNHNYYTDIITFNYNQGNKISGDLLISLERIKDNSTHFNENFNKELYRVIFHGVLHLLGYEDKDEATEKVMRIKEDYYLTKYGI